jgi:hypothetical protein
MGHHLGHHGGSPLPLWWCQDQGINALTEQGQGKEQQAKQEGRLDIASTQARPHICFAIGG